MWRRVVRQARHRVPTDRHWAVAICIDSSAGIRGVRSARCKVAQYWYRLQNRTLQCHQEQICSRSDGQPLTFLVYLLWKYKIYLRWCRLSCVWYIPSIFSSTFSTTSHYLKCRLLNLHGVTCQQGKHVTAVRSSDLNHKQTAPSDLFTDTLTIKLLTHTIRYLILQSRVNQILAEISRTCWVSYKMRSEFLKVVIMMLLITMVQPL